ncbi:MAG TPA: 1-acyl-sn-glycerol-3-phosphate acyltransferase [Candidatus Methylomirabilis sp.]|nr:1-acyl-sn-glycerol-3-phosphate acyltransferase [Candidatus Methylomirabilis sp.]
MATLTGTDFRPAKPWPWLITLGAQLNRLLLRRDTELDIRPEDLAVLRNLPPGCLIAPNHAHHADPQVTFELARRAGRRVNFMATREAFDIAAGCWGWFLQRFGVFSVNRGGVNVEARKFARSVLINGAYDLAMFPEGEVYLLNDVVMPLKPGAARLAFDAARDLERQGRRRPIFIVPVAIKYQFAENITPALEATTARLEAQVLGGARTGPLYPRIVALGTELLSRAEERYGVKPDSGLDLYERVRRLRRILLERLERKHLGKVQDGFDFDRARRLMIRIQGLLLGKAGAPGFSGFYDAPTAPSDDPFTADLEAATLCARSVAFRDDYLIENPSPERMAETLTKLEREVLGKQIRSPLGKRRAIIRIPPPLDIQEYLAREKAGTPLDEVIEAVVVRLHDTLQTTLDAISRKENE